MFFCKCIIKGFLSIFLNIWYIIVYLFFDYEVKEKDFKIIERNFSICILIWNVYKLILLYIVML